jgi:hypothetical protein
MNLIFVAGLLAMSGPAAAVTADQVAERYSVFDFTIVDIDLIADDTVFVVAAVQDGQAVVFFVDAESGEAIADNETIQRLLALMQTDDAGIDVLDWFENQVEDLVAEANHAVTAAFRMLAELDAGDQLIGQLESIASRLLAGVEQAAREAVAGFEDAVRDAVNPEWLASRLLRPVESALRDLLRQIERLLGEIGDIDEGRDDGVVEEEEVAEEEEEEENAEEEEGEPDLTEWIEAVLAEVEREVAGMFAEAEHAARDLIEEIGDEIAELPEELQPAALQALEVLASSINGLLAEAEGIAERALQSLADAMEQNPEDAEALAAEALDIAENALREALAAIEAAAGEI